MYGYIYITTNKINGKIYIGQRKGKYDKNYFGSGKFIIRAIEKYKIENFENHIIEFVESREKANEREKYWIKKYSCSLRSGDGYNIAEGGNGGNVFEHFDERTKCKIFKKRGKSISKSLTGKKLSKEHRESLSKSHKGLPANNSIKVIDVFTNIEYSSITKAAACLKCDKRAIMRSLKERSVVKLKDGRTICFSYQINAEVK